MPKKELKIKWCESTVIDALQPYTHEIMECIARIAEQPGVLDSFVSDRTSIGDFLLDYELTGETRPDPRDKTKDLEVITHDTAANREIARRVSEELGVPVDVNDRLYEVAIRLRDR